MTKDKKFKKSLSRYLSRKDLWEIVNFIQNELPTGTMGINITGLYFYSDEERLKKTIPKIYQLIKRLNK